MSDTFLKRTTLIVEDAKRSIAFYRDIMGMTVYYDQPMQLGGAIVAVPQAAAKAKVHLGIMEGSHKEIAKIGLLQWTDPPLERPGPYRTRMGIGDVVMVTETPDLKSYYERLQKSPDCRIVCPPHDWAVPAPDGKGQIEMTTMSFFDPDGFFYEVNHKRNVPNMDRYAIRRTTLIVRDVDRSLKFYRDVMGLELWYDREMTVGGQVLPAGEPNAKVRVAILKCDDPQVGMLGVMAFLDPPIPVPPPRKNVLGIRDVIFVAGAKDVNAIYKRMDGADCAIHAPPTADTVPGPDGKPVHMTTMSFFDPDGYFFELNTRH